ncbi:MULTISPECIES: hypothetical protein [Pseudomonas]|uniref:hypothetical protein n=1 Tax=Pseudomonas TaxID=286 RepID=UPI0025AA0804|nr:MULTISPECIES: hypothetical protein [Pseudomonas]MDM9596953.1 hypothetical protein [Pseudomonas shirazica]MDO2416356.1 hypothetical protein [Pseudomonas shirazica]MDS9588921.1 hypothetical protein [Pseudomonas sp. HTZ1]
MNSAIREAEPLSNLKQGVASTPARMYRPPVAANSATGIGVLNSKADTPPLARFFCVRSTAMPLWAGRAGSIRAQQPLDCHANLHGSALHDWRHGSGVLDRNPRQKSMTTHHILTLNPSKARAAFHRACALAALHADSSLSVRLKRYNAAMAKARALEAQGGAQ